MSSLRFPIESTQIKDIIQNSEISYSSIDNDFFVLQSNLYRLIKHVNPSYQFKHHFNRRL